MTKQHSPRRVVVTGMGVVSSLGTTLEELWNSCVSGRSGVRATKADEPYPVSNVAPVDAFSGKIQDFGEMPDAKKKAIRKGLKLMAREIQLAVAAAQKAVADARLDAAREEGLLPPRRVGVSFASDYVYTTSKELIDGIVACRAEDGSLDAPRWPQDGLPKMTPIWQLKYLTNMPASHITIYNELFASAHDVTNREASFGVALGEAVEKVKSGKADAMLVGATGSRLESVRLAAFLNEGELADDLLDRSTDSVSRPFDKRRRGAIPGEGSAAVFIEELESAKKRGATIYAEIVGGTYRGSFRHAREVDGWTSNDCQIAQTFEDARDSIASALRALFRKCGISPSDVGFIDASARGDVRLDAAEAAALREVFGDALDSIPTTALSGLLGNPGCGCGAIQTVAAILSLQNDALVPVANLDELDSACPISPVREFGGPTGDSFVKICAQSVGQASALYLKRCAD
ncbi:MAG: beta-ketoacyl-[Thermoguttaceae bacterium]|nr:beta-ketoacyl-[acyl-carrier-protein] synthase family protein [Thermoguttaceae bacterium]